MGKIRSFTDLDVWKKADDLFFEVVQDIENFPATKVAYIITDQLVRSVGSVSANIAEGFGRRGRNEFSYCLGIARGEGNEALNWYFKVLRLKYISEDIFLKRQDSLVQIQKMLSGLISKIKI